MDKEEEAGLDLGNSFDVDGMEEEEEEEEEEGEEEDEPAVEELLEARSARAARRRASHLAESGDEGQQQEEEDEEEEEGGVAAPISPPPLVAAGSWAERRRTSVGSGVPPPFDSPQTPLWLRAAQTQLANTPLPHAEFIGCEDTETEIASERPISPPAATEIAKLTAAPSPKQGLATRDGRSRGRKGLAVAGVTALVLLLLLLLVTLSSGDGGGPAATPAAPLDMQPAEEPTTASDVVTTGSRPPAVAISPPLPL